MPERSKKEGKEGKEPADAQGSASHGTPSAPPPPAALLQQKYEQRRLMRGGSRRSLSDMMSSLLKRLPRPRFALPRKKLTKIVDKDLAKKEAEHKKKAKDEQLLETQQVVGDIKLPSLGGEGLPDAPRPSSSSGGVSRKGLLGIFKKKKDKFAYTVYDERSVEKERERSYNELKKKVLLENAVAKVLVQSAKKEKRKKMKRRDLQEYLDKCGFDHIDAAAVPRYVMRTTIVIMVLLTIVVFSMGVVNRPGAMKVVLFMVGLWTGVFAFVYILLWFSLFTYLDFRMFNRRLEVEEILPDYLQLTSANIAAGMTIDKALWYAVRPRFGILAKEIETVAKLTIVGHDLGDALYMFASRYDSRILYRSVDILLEGLASGGKMGDLLNKIAINIQEGRILRREMAANVMTYVIFISFATVAAAPFLFALSTQLLVVIQGIADMLIVSGVGGSSSSMIPINISDKSITLGDFKIFSFAVLLVTSLFSACIISVISKGNVKEGIKYIPIFMGVSVVLYFLGLWALGIMFSSFL